MGRSTFQKRLKRVMKRRGDRVADLARYFGVPYTTVREWAVYGRFPSLDLYDRLDRMLTHLEQHS